MSIIVKGSFICKFYIKMHFQFYKKKEEKQGKALPE